MTKIKCNKIGCDKDAEVCISITVPCLNCDIEEHILIGAEFCRTCNHDVHLTQITKLPEFVTLMTNLMVIHGHIPNFDKAALIWIPLTSDQYQMYSKLKDSSKFEHVTAHTSYELGQAIKPTLH